MKRKKTYEVKNVCFEGNSVVTVQYNPVVKFPLHSGELLQCTGLKDKNGKPIYEGDFIQSRFNGLGRIVYYHAALVVAWKNEVCFYGHTTTSTPIPLDTENIEVIGNIHENPELLK